MMTDKNGSIWIGSQAGLFRYDSSASSTGGKSLTRMTANFTPNLFEDQTGNIWFGGDLNRYDRKSIVHYTLQGRSEQQ
jgi:ligand-binding sensor domain-containing protein